MISKLGIYEKLIDIQRKSESFSASLNFFFEKIFSLEFLIFFFIFFILIFLIIKNINSYHINFRDSTCVFHFFIFSATLYLFPINLPYGDIWEEYQKINNNNAFDYLFSVNWSGHKFFNFKLFFYIVNEYLNLNLIYIHLISFLFYSSAIFIYLKFLNEIKLKYFFILLPLLFSGKWFNHIFETINLAWVLNFFLTLLIIYYLNLKKNFKLFQILSIFVLLLLNLGAGYIVLIYLIIHCILNDKINVKKKLVFLLCIVGILILTNLIIPPFKDESTNLISKYLIYFSSEKLFDIIITFFGLIPSIYLPNVLFKFDLFKILIILTGLFQSILLVVIYINSKIDIKKFILDNPFLILGIIGCLIISIMRINHFDQVRYVSYSIIFQIGFFIFIMKSKIIISFFDRFYKFIFTIFILLYLFNLITPNTGIFFSPHRFMVKTNIETCLSNNNLNKCEDLIYNELFFYGNWFNKDNFKVLLNKMSEEKKSFFYDKK